MPPRDQAQFLAALLSPEFLRIAPYVPLPRLNVYSHYHARQHVDACGTGVTDGEGVERPGVCLQHGEFTKQFDWAQLTKPFDWGRIPFDTATIVNEDEDDEMPELESQDESDCRHTGRVRGFKPRNLCKL
ncbi:hypothetical protein B0H11DRAFT_2259952 [Mycena galericulata]|nr:hypothetical protein B0H11DRAFT_2259952 [Mycena galericulata]